VLYYFVYPHHPASASYPIGVASDLAYKLALRLKLVRPFPSSAGDLEGGYTLAPGGARAEAERRRALALKALDQRLAHNQGSGSNGPAGPAEVAGAPSRPSPVAVVGSSVGGAPSSEAAHSQKTES